MKFTQQHSDRLDLFVDTARGFMHDKLWKLRVVEEITKSLNAGGTMERSSSDKSSTRGC